MLLKASKMRMGLANYSITSYSFQLRRILLLKEKILLRREKGIKGGKKKRREGGRNA